MDLKDKKVLVVGAGRSGVEACRLLLRAGARPILSDSKERDQLSRAVLDLEKQGVELMTGRQFADRVDWQLAVVSPGVPPMIPLLNITREAGVEVIGEIELAWRFSHAPFLGVTGTNGKTTTTSLLGFILQQAGKNVLVGGNIGAALALDAASFTGDYIVAELSSFQLETCNTFRPHVAIHLNLTPDHLDRHGSMENYAAAKESMFLRQSGEDYAVLNYDDPIVSAIAGRTEASVLWLSLEHELDEGMYFDGEAIRVREQGRTVYSFPAADIFIKGRHNMQNAMAAALAAHAVGVSYEDIAGSLAAFPGVAHRLEFVCRRRGVTYVNDSKGTNPDSTLQALRAYDGPIVLLLGGYDKNADFSQLVPLIREKVKLAVVYGATLPKIKTCLLEHGFDRFVTADGFREAVAAAKKAAVSGDVVMLSPACASWDEFDNFEQRGDLFKELVSK
ncbi:MAG: UDP-N-acetylmuramoyl-L-alanine--D-glutamate ligase [Firmicutes bacterium]|nr:UDP-N-acetylmuramoyl-L-alanine--D-glutamate ligase [Bacillota bacterium]